MGAIDNMRPQLSGSVRLVSFIGFLFLGTSYAETEGETDQSSDSAVVAFTLLDTREAIDSYRAERYKKAAGALASSSLKHEHMELVANAISKMFAGVPVSTYTESEREEGSSDESTESTANWIIGDDGRIQRENESIFRQLNSPSPFVVMPSVPFNAASGRVLNESDTEATFVFDVDMKMDADDEGEFAGMADKMKWVAEVLVDKNEQAPKAFTMKLDKPLRKRFIFKITTLKIEWGYVFNEGCASHIVNRITTEMDGSAIGAGKLHQFTEATYSDIECEQPLRFLLPDDTESNFVGFN